MAWRGHLNQRVGSGTAADWKMIGYEVRFRRRSERRHPRMRHHMDAPEGGMKCPGPSLTSLEQSLRAERLPSRATVLSKATR